MERTELSAADISRLVRQHYLSPSDILEAKNLFDHYYELEHGIAPPEQTDAPKKKKNSVDNDPSTGKEEQKAEGEAPGTPEADAPLPSSENVRRLQVKGLEQFFKDMNIPKSPLDITDLIDALSGPRPLLNKQRVVEGAEDKEGEEPAREKSKSRASSPMREPEAPKKKVVTDTVQKVPDGPLGVCFPMFLSLLQMFYDGEGEEYRNEDYETAFQMIDADGDGGLTVQDVRAAIEYFNKEAEEGIFDTDHCLGRLANMHDAEIKLALTEADLDGDGVVSISDAIAILEHS
ncbi:hypothetical protein AGDE_14006 [Angomonas deanei]|uniref:EF-hand domain pair/EF hand, putative n=1 Tax=Angomonas deanei TaxID=59799 RepID=A0A7G2CHD2_9TRYP|nr:hypothetical protein AGDE_14006 [Angomonas deanei]CAD2219166.1 EF-hand domain pair/EF hand, putative [Angomonas deanei]|eukprot:EPY21535.1 hypothetical protein AGDE_14006 [Angomonas deanei]